MDENLQESVREQQGLLIESSKRLTEIYEETEHRIAMQTVRLDNIERRMDEERAYMDDVGSAGLILYWHARGYEVTQEQLGMAMKTMAAYADDTNNGEY